MHQKYIAIVEQDAAPGYSIFFPDFPGCVSAGDTVEEAVSMGREALSGHIALMLDTGATIPEPTLPDHIVVDPDVQEVTRVLIEVTREG